MSDYPSCFADRKQFADWVKFARFSKPHPNHSYCEDCTAEYKDKMVKQNRCGFPEVKFKKCRDGGFEGFRSASEIKALKDVRFQKYLKEITA
jgi:hypothetical protein